MQDKEKRREYNRNYKKNKYKNDPLFRKKISKINRQQYEKRKDNEKEYRLNLRKQIQSIYENKCERCGITDSDVLTINHKLPPKNEVYKGLYRYGWMLYKQLLERPDVRQYFNLLCYNCQFLDSLEKMDYFSKTSKTNTIYKRKVKEKICKLFDNKCSVCQKQFPFWLLSVDHTNGGGRRELKERLEKGFFQYPQKEIISKLNSGEWNLRCYNCNCNRNEVIKWAMIGWNKKHLNNEKISDE